MTNELETEPAVTTLVSGIVQDAQELVRQQLTLFQVEFKIGMHRTAAAVIPLAAGAVVCLIAGIILAAALAVLLPTIWPGLPQWAGFAIVGGLCGALGAALVFWGKSQ